MNEKLFEEIEKEIDLFMFNIGITKKAGLYFFENDNGIFEKLFAEHMADREVEGLRSISEDLYLRILGMHAFGAGAYLAAKETEYEREAAEFTEEEIEGIFSDFEEKDVYELALEKMNISLESGNRKMLDRIIIIGIKEEKLFSGDEIFGEENLKAFMKVLFNVGATVYKTVKMDNYS